MLYAHHRWDLRNNSAHTVSRETNTFKHNKLVMELKQIYAQKEDMLLEDRVLLEQTPTQIDNMKIYQLQKLIKTIAPIVRQSINKAKKLGKRQRKITSYFTQTMKNHRSPVNDIIFLPPTKRLKSSRPLPEPDPNH